MTRCLILPAVLAAGCGRPTDDSKGNALPVDLTAALRGYEIVVKSAKIKPVKADGSKWDFGATKPDPYVKVSVMEGDKLTRHGQTRVINGSLHAVWDQPVLTVDAGEWVVFHVKDKDVQFDDRIGLHLEAMTPELLEKGEFRVAFDQVEELVVSVRKSPAAIQKEKAEAAAAKAREEERKRQEAETLRQEQERFAAEQAKRTEDQRRAALVDQENRRRAAADTQLRQAEADERRLVQQIGELNNERLAAGTAVAGARVAVGRTQEGTGSGLAADLALAVALRWEQEVLGKISAAQFQLQAARTRISQLRT